jgi:hypothetical protein
MHDNHPWFVIATIQQDRAKPRSTNLKITHQKLLLLVSSSINIGGTIPTSSSSILANPSSHHDGNSRR